MNKTRANNLFTMHVLRLADKVAVFFVTSGEFLCMMSITTPVLWHNLIKLFLLYKV